MTDRLSELETAEAHAYATEVAARRCGFAGPPPGTPQGQIVMSHETNLFAGELVCFWDELQESGSAPYRHSETVLPLFDWSN